MFWIFLPQIQLVHIVGNPIFLNRSMRIIVEYFKDCTYGDVTDVL